MVSFSDTWPTEATAVITESCPGANNKIFYITWILKRPYVPTTHRIYYSLGDGCGVICIHVAYAGQCMPAEWGGAPETILTSRIYYIAIQLSYIAYQEAFKETYENPLRIEILTNWTNIILQIRHWYDSFTYTWLIY